MKAINTEFNTIETIANSNYSNKSQSYKMACDIFCIQADEFLDNECFMSSKSAKEVYNMMSFVNDADCEYSIYRAALLVEGWLAKSYNNAE